MSSASAVPTAADPAAPPQAPAAAPPVVVDFVSENDVRAAITRSQKIHIGPRTIVTPSARDLAADRNILVMTQDGTRERKT